MSVLVVARSSSEIPEALMNNSVLDKTILMQVPTAARWAIPGFYEFLGPSSDAVAFSVFQGYGAASLGEWYPIFQVGVVVSKRRGTNRPAMWRSIQEE